MFAMQQKHSICTRDGFGFIVFSISQEGNAVTTKIINDIEYIAGCKRYLDEDNDRCANIL